MGSIILIVYGLYFVVVGVRGNAPQLTEAIVQEGTFAYWVMVLLIVAAMWESQSGEKVAKPLALLIVVGFLLKNSNWQTIATNARNITKTGA